MSKKEKAYFHLPGLFEFYELYKVFLPLFYHHREYFYDWCEIGSIYGSPEDCLWGGGRLGEGNQNPYEVLSLMDNSLLQEKHLQDKRCNDLCALFEKSEVQSGIIIHSDLLLEYLKKQYPRFYFVSSTTKVLTKFEQLVDELKKDDFLYVVPDFRLNKVQQLENLLQKDMDKVEFLCNECCFIGCLERKKCHEGYRFSKAMQNSSFISVEDIQNNYLPKGFSQFKIEGRSLGSALVLEFLLYYMVKPEYQIHVREAIYLDNMLDLF